HEAQSKNVFAEGALRAGKFILDKKCGMFNMDDLLA
ncbi:MAG: dihydrodipicolinate reductase C-terminal domain-containing protein, partial [Clostridia bacterium]